MSSLDLVHYLTLGSNAIGITFGVCLYNSKFASSKTLNSRLARSARGITYSAVFSSFYSFKIYALIVEMKSVYYRCFFATACKLFLLTFIWIILDSRWWFLWVILGNTRTPRHAYCWRFNAQTIWSRSYETSSVAFFISWYNNKDRFEETPGKYSLDPKLLNIKCNIKKKSD